MGQPESVLEASLRRAHLEGRGSLKSFWSEPLSSHEDFLQAYFCYRENAPLDISVVFYETMSGDRMNDNPYAIFRYLREHPELGTFLHVWSLGEHGTIPEEFAAADDVVFAARGTLAYAYYLACAGRIVCNATLPELFTRRDGQLYLNTWHGIPYKAVGRNAVRARFSSPSGLGTFLKATHVITPCEFMTDALITSYSMAGASTARVAEIGYPRVDLTVNASDSTVARLLQTLGIVDDGNTGGHPPVVLYAPTWRSEGGSDTIDGDRLMDDLSALAELDITLLYRGHHRISRLIRDQTVGDSVGHVIVPPQETSSNELLAAVDILITDYSSIFFDFLPLGRPIIHYVYDLDEYTATRGLNLAADELPGEVASSRAELVAAVAASAAALRALPAGTDLARDPIQGERYRAAQARFCPHEDGGASARAVGFFFADNEQGLAVRTPRDGRPTIAFWAGRLTDDAASRAFLRRVIQFAKSSHYQVTMVVDRAAIFDKAQLKSVKDLKLQLSCIAYDAIAPTILPAEEDAYRVFVSEQRVERGAVWRAVRRSPVLVTVFSREYRRRMDDAHFDALVLGPHLNGHELALAAFACPKAFSFGAARKFRPTPVSVRVRVANFLLPRDSKRRAAVQRLLTRLRRRR